MGLAFTKMHGLGNDFVVIDGVSAPVSLDGATVRRIADRRRGVGCDQVLVVEPARAGGDLGYRIFNADGGEAEQCGNGARCVARFAHERGLVPADTDTVRFHTRGGRIRARLLATGDVAVDMGRPRFDPADIPFSADAVAASYELEAGGTAWSVRLASIGNPHAVLRVADVTTAPVAVVGPELEHHHRFPHRANVGFVEVVKRDRIRLRVWERGAGETAACGTGACAAAAVGRRAGWLDDRVTVALPGGELVIDWDGTDNPLWMTGPAETAFYGTLA